MKRIEFIAPVESMRGNLTGPKQRLEYNPDRNPAWDAPSDERSYALNYQPIFIGAKRSNGRTYFQVKTKSAVTMSSAMRLQCALLSAQSRVSYLIQQTIQGQTDVLEQYEHSQYKALGWTYNRFLQAFIRGGLENHAPAFFFNAAGYSSVIYNNPFSPSTIPGAIDINLEPSILVKFWEQLAPDPIIFFVDGDKGVAIKYDSWNILVESNYNVLGLVIDNTEYIKYKNLYLYDEEIDDYVPSSLEIIPNHKYTLRAL